MTFTVRFPRSIEARLAISIGALLTVLWIGAAYVTTVILRDEMNEVFDSTLQEAAQRLLFERQDKSAVEPLRRLLSTTKSSLARVHTLHTLEGLNALSAEIILPVLKDPDPRVRTHAVQLSDPFLDSSPQLAAAIVALADDPDDEVLMQVAFSLGELTGDQGAEGLARIAPRIGKNDLLRD